MKMITYIKIYRHKNDFHFTLTAANGDEILTSEISHSFKSCNKSIDLLKVQSKYFENYQKEENDKGQYYFTINDSHQQLLATSFLFWSEISRNYAMNIVRKECFEAEIQKGRKYSLR